jgi:hypothetical protein
MNTHAEKTQENKSQVVSADDSQMQSGGESIFQFFDNRPEAFAQRKLKVLANNSPQVKQTAQFLALADNSQQQQPIQKKENNTGLPDNLKSGIEKLSGYSMDDVKVHYNSDKPAQLEAHAYTQGTDIHIEAGQEKHLPHEAWHVVQQKQGQVKPILQMKGRVSINDEVGLETEADVMGGKAIQMTQIEKMVPSDYPRTIQLKFQKTVNKSSQTKDNVQLVASNSGQVIQTMSEAIKKDLQASLNKELKTRERTDAISRIDYANGGSEAFPELLPLLSDPDFEVVDQVLILFSNHKFTGAYDQMVSLALSTIDEEQQFSILSYIKDLEDEVNIPFWNKVLSDTTNESIKEMAFERITSEISVDRYELLISLFNQEDLEDDFIEKVVQQLALYKTAETHLRDRLASIKVGEQTALVETIKDALKEIAELLDDDDTFKEDVPPVLPKYTMVRIHSGVKSTTTGGGSNVRYVALAGRTAWVLEHNTDSEYEIILDDETIVDLTTDTFDVVSGEVPSTKVAPLAPPPTDKVSPPDAGDSGDMPFDSHPNWEQLQATFLSYGFDIQIAYKERKQHVVVKGVRNPQNNQGAIVERVVKVGRGDKSSTTYSDLEHELTHVQQQTDYFEKTGHYHASEITISQGLETEGNPLSDGIVSLSDENDAYGEIHAYMKEYIRLKKRNELTTAGEPIESISRRVEEHKVKVGSYCADYGVTLFADFKTVEAEYQSFIK